MFFFLFACHTPPPPECRHQCSAEKTFFFFLYRIYLPEVSAQSFRFFQRPTKTARGKPNICNLGRLTLKHSPDLSAFPPAVVRCNAYHRSVCSTADGWKTLHSATPVCPRIFGALSPPGPSPSFTLQQRRKGARPLRQKLPKCRWFPETHNAGDAGRGERS